MAKFIRLIIAAALVAGGAAGQANAGRAALGTIKAAQPAAKGPWICRLWEKSNNGPWKCRLWEKSL